MNAVSFIKTLFKKYTFPNSWLSADLIPKLNSCSYSED